MTYKTSPESAARMYTTIIKQHQELLRSGELKSQMAIDHSHRQIAYCAGMLKKLWFPS